MLHYQIHLFAGPGKPIEVVEEKVKSGLGDGIYVQRGGHFTTGDSIKQTAKGKRLHGRDASSQRRQEATINLS